MSAGEGGKRRREGGRRRIFLELPPAASWLTLLLFGHYLWGEGRRERDFEKWSKSQNLHFFAAAQSLGFLGSEDPSSPLFFAFLPTPLKKKSWSFFGGGGGGKSSLLQLRPKPWDYQVVIWTVEEEEEKRKGLVFSLSLNSTPRNVSIPPGTHLTLPGILIVLKCFCLCLCRLLCLHCVSGRGAKPWDNQDFCQKRHRAREMLLIHYYSIKTHF